MVLPVIRVGVEADTLSAEQGLQRVDQHIENLRRTAPRASGATGGLSGRLRGLGSVSNRTRAQIQNASFQLQDLIVQLQGGTRASTAFAQQLPQLLGGFGAVGAAAGVLAGIGIPALAIAFGSASGESRDFGEQLDDLEESIKRYAETSRLANLSTGELAEQFRELTPQITAATRVLADLNLRDAQNQIDTLTNSLSERFGTRGAGELRTNIANAFDVNIFLAFTDAQRESREEARRLTAEFLNAQRALQAAEGDVDAQSEALLRLLNVAEELALVKDGISDTEAEILREIAESLRLTELLRDANSRAADTGGVLRNVIGSAQVAAAALVATSENLDGPITRAALAAGNLAKNLFNSAEAQARIVQAAQARGGGRGADPRQFGFDVADLAGIRLGGGTLAAPRDERRQRQGRGGGGREDRSGIEALVEELQTEQETIERFRQEGLELLAQANTEELELIGGHDEARLRLQREYMNRLGQLRSQERDQTLNIYSNLFGNLATLFQQGNDRAFRISKAFGIAQALIGTYQGAAEALKLPWPANLAAAASVIAQGLGYVAAIRSVSSSGGGSGGTAGGGTTPVTGGGEAAAAPRTFVNVNLVGEGAIGRGQVRNLIGMINEEIEDGAVLGGIRVSGA